MTTPGPDERFEVPVERLARGRRDGRRAALAAMTIVAVVGTALGLARWTSDAGIGTPGESPAPNGSEAARAVASAPADRVAPRRSAGPRIERLLDLPDRALDGAPHLLLVEQDGSDLRLLRWTAGGGLTQVTTIPGATAGLTGPVGPLISRSADRIVVLSQDDRPGSVAGAARLVDLRGTILWTGDDVEVQSGAVWSSDDRQVVIAGQGRQWHLVSVADAGRAADRVVALPGEIFLPSPTPIGSISIPRVAPRTVPLGYSADGRWIYGGIVSRELGIVVGEFRVSRDGRRVERVMDVGVGRDDGLSPEPGTLGGRIVDPATGRVANWLVNVASTGRAPTLEVREPDSAFAFALDVGSPLGSEWVGDGSLVVLSSDSALFPDALTLARVDGDGSVGSPILETGPVNGGTLLGVRGGFASMAVATATPDAAAQVVLVDIDDPARAAALLLPSGGSGAIIAAELRP
jgi:hypothetical protein